MLTAGHLEKEKGKKGTRAEQTSRTGDGESRGVKRGADDVGNESRRLLGRKTSEVEILIGCERSHEKGAKDGTAGRQGEPREHDTQDEESDFGPDEAFPPGSITNKHPRLTDHQLVVMMKQAIADRTKGKLREIDKDVWDRKGDLKEPYEYLLRLPITKNPEDSFTTEEKRIFMNGTPKSRRSEIIMERNELHEIQEKLRR
ncbi:MAG: hypothetical protein M1816_005663 [Peltula sp. TS41687]|nr:MAG: hypothetical protein M1816_005663 [Peltula sp. TS41687]